VIQAKGIWVGWPGLLEDVNEPVPQSDLSDKTLTAGLLSENVRYLNWPSDSLVSVSVYAITWIYIVLPVIINILLGIITLNLLVNAFILSN
jgi:hypothetical protein